MAVNHDEAGRVVATLAERFPACFFVDSRKPVPIKCGIDKELIEALDQIVEPEAIRLALAIYCGHYHYLRTLVVGADRIGLDGAVAGSVNEDEAKGAAMRAAKQRLRRQRAEAAQNTREKIDKDILAAAKAKPTPPARIGFTDLRTAAQARKRVFDVG
jgi:ProP effector